MSDDKNLAFAVASWLSSQSASSASASKLEEASKLVSEAYGIDVNSAQQKALYGKGPGLKNVWDVFMKTQAKMGGGAAAPAADASSGSASSSKSVSDEDKAKAEQLKGEGNKAMSAKDYGAAIDAYTKAIEIHPTNPVYFSNRSAAYAQVQQHDNAIEDAREASRVDPKFGKAYSRLGHALFSSGRYEEAVEAYEKGVEVDPSNALMKSGLETARQHAAKSSSSSSTPAPAAGTASRDVGEAAGGAGGFPGMGGGAGGMPDLSAMMNNPMIAQMAQSMMANGGLEQMMNNPMIQQMMSRFGGGGAGGGGMPDINALMQDPQMRDLARSFMGGAGGAGAGAGGAGRGAGRGAGGSNAGDDMFS
jgi:small glutamine-rich tetratricopeptide repeat-containing protein alpha